MTPYNHAFLIVGGFHCWVFLIFTVDGTINPLDKPVQKINKNKNKKSLVSGFYMEFYGV